VSSLRSLESFVPLDLCRDLLPAAGAEGTFSSRRFAGAVMFADVSGFSRLADRLFRRYGARGGELLTGVLTDFFGRLVEITTRHHGEIVKWSGDAFLAIWRDEELAGRAIAAAAACAHELVQHTMTPEQVPDVTLKVRAALTTGELLAARVGGWEDRWEIVVTGAPVRQIAAALAAAPPSAAVLSAEAARKLGKSAKVTARAGGLAQLVDAPALPERKPIARRALGADDEALVRSLVPEPVLRRLESGLDDWFSEMRHVTSVFLLAHGLDPTAEGGVEQLHRAVAAAQASFARHGGVLAQAGADDKGVWFLGGFGLPPTRSETRADHALLAAWEAQRALEGLGVRASGGVASGRAFCGLVGSATRREFTFTSRVVNLSARLMTRTEDAILVDASTAARSHGAMVVVERAPELFAGFEAPITTFALTGIAKRADDARETHAPRAHGLVGRERERAVLGAAIAGLATGARRCVVIEGEAGLGKSVLLAEAVRSAPPAARVVRAGAERATRTTPYGAFQRVFAELLSVPLEMETEAERKRIEARLLQTYPELAPQAALLNGALPVLFEDGPETAALTGLPRAESTRRLLLSILETAASAGPLVLVVEDAHSLDGLSWKLLVTAVGQIDPLVTLVSMRPVDAPHADRSRLVELPFTDVLALGPLGEGDVAALVARTLGGETPAHLSSWLARRSGGNPFFVHELLTSLIADGHVAVAEGQLPRVATPTALDAVPVPLDLESVLTSHIDRLSPAAQMVLKVSSVVGPSFTAELVQRAHAGAGDVEATLEALRDAELIEKNDAGFRFSHETLHRVAYELLPIARRRAIHEAVALHFEERHAGDPKFFTGTRPRTSRRRSMPSTARGSRRCARALSARRATSSAVRRRASSSAVSRRRRATRWTSRGSRAGPTTDRKRCSRSARCGSRRHRESARSCSSVGPCRQARRGGPCSRWDSCSSRSGSARSARGPWTRTTRRDRC
jgi:class 3 adenylate cyclase